MNTDRADLIPVRALNQVSYCPRLYYLEYVESVMPINEHVEDGLFQHRRVNDPGLANRTRKEGDALRTRSVSISSERLGISGKLDLLEEKGEATRPVEYKRSAAPKDEAASRPPGRTTPSSSAPRASWSKRAWASRSRRHPLLHRLEGAGRRPVRRIAAGQDAGGDRADPRAVGARRRPRAAAGRAAAPLLRLLARPGLPARGDALPDPPARARAARRTGRGPTSRRAALARRLADAGDPQNDDKAVLYLHEPGSHVGRRSEHLVVSHRGRRSTGCRSPRSARSSSSATSRSRPRPCTRWPRPRSRCRTYRATASSSPRCRARRRRTWRCGRASTGPSPTRSGRSAWPGRSSPPRSPTSGRS